MSTMISNGRDEAALREEIVVFGRSLFDRGSSPAAPGQLAGEF